MALILEFRKKLAPVRKTSPAVATVTGSVVLFTGVRYERIASPEIKNTAKSALSRKPPGQKGSRAVEVVA